MKSKVSILAVFIFNVFSVLAEQHLYDFSLSPKSSGAEAFKLLQEIRLKNAQEGLIFITPEVASREISEGIKIKETRETRIIAYLCKALNASYRRDDNGNYFIMAALDEVFKQGPGG